MRRKKEKRAFKGFLETEQTDKARPVEEEMAVCSSLCALPNPLPKISSTKIDTGAKVFDQITLKLYKGLSSSNTSKYCSTRLNAGLSAVEPDLSEEPIDRYSTPGVDPDDFEYGKWDGHHTYVEGQDKDVTFWGGIMDDIAAVETPTGFQGFISWLFLPAVAAGMYFDVPREYLFIGAGLFTIVFCIIEMDKPDKPHNFEPQIYNMERGARDKLIDDYNSMSIWDFNEKYGDLWDFTVTKDDITKR